MSAKFLFLINWQIDARLKSIPKKEFSVIETPYGKIYGMDEPAGNYQSGCTTVGILCCELNDTEVDRFRKRIELTDLRINRVRLLFGQKGFLTLEAECDYLCKSFRECPENRTLEPETDAENLSLLFSSYENLAFYEEIVSYANPMLIRNKNFWFGGHVVINKLLDEKELFRSSIEESIIYNYQTFVDTEEDAQSYLQSCHIDKEPIVVDGCPSWHEFANHVWLTPSDISIEKMERLAFTLMPTSWELLIFDVGAITYKNILQLRTDGIKVPTEAIRQVINRDNMQAIDLGLMIRNMNTAQYNVILGEMDEGFASRKELFESAQKILTEAANGFDSNDQSKTSRMMEMILTILTAMSVYSVACDACSLLLMETESLSFHFLSSILFIIATIVMLVIFLLSRKKER
ncbi:MAG: hypothetical protein MJY98_03980 [Fibrobacter sp.]|nr:hypothetical protein [Fibrobacter sp.]